MNLLKKNKKYGEIAFYGIFFVLAILKLFIVSNNEILALYQPHDDLWFINAATHAYWFGKYTQMKFIHLPIFPIFIYITHFFAIPLRIILEVFFISSSFYLSYSLLKAGINKFFCITIFILIIFHPLSIGLFNHTLAETFYAPLLIFSIANLIMLWMHKEDKSSIYFSILTGISFALLWFTRDENILIAALFSLFFIIIIIILYLEKFSKKKTFDFIKKIVIIPAICIIVMGILINSANYLAFGVFARSELQGSGYKSAYTALQKIKPSETIRFVPLTTEVREKAYEVSPTFNKIQPILEDHSNFAFYYTKHSQSIENEMAAGWFYWMLRDAVYQTGYKTGKSADEFYNQVAKEINQAIQEKKIESRMVLLSFIDPYFYKFLPYFPESFLKISRLFFDTNEPPLENDASGLPKEIVTLVDKMANRRQDAIKQTTIGSIQGWAFIDGDEITNITLTKPDGSQIASTETNIERPDVLVGFKKNTPLIKTPLKSGFSLQFKDYQVETTSVNIVFNSKKCSFVISLNSIKEGIVIKNEICENEKTLYFAVDNKTFPKIQKNDPLKTEIQHYIWKVYGNIVLYLTILGLFFVILIIATYKYIKEKNLIIILIALLFVVLTRVMLFSILDMNSWNGAQPRYIFPVMPLYSTALLIIIYLGWKGVISKIKSKRQPKKMES